MHRGSGFLPQAVAKIRNIFETNKDLARKIQKKKIFGPNGQTT
jgi:hypothetical protein